MSQQEIVGSILEVVDDLKHKITDGEYLKICAGLQKLVLKGNNNDTNNVSDISYLRIPYINIEFLIKIRSPTGNYMIDETYRTKCLVKMISNHRLCTNRSKLDNGKCGVHRSDRCERISEVRYRSECQELISML